MASGSFGVSTSNGYISGHVDWSESNENIANNTTDVTATMYLSRTNTGYTSYGTDTFRVSINGGDYYNTLSYSLTYNSNTQMVTGTATVPHNADGTVSIPIGWGGGGGSGGVFTVNSGSSNVTLMTIPRASTVSGSPTFTAGTQNLPISLNVASSSFHHSIQLFVLETNGSTWDFVGQRDNIGSSTTWVFTDAEIKQLYTTNAGYESRPILLRVFTYDSSNNSVGSYQDNSSGLMYAVATATTTLGSGSSFNIGTSISYSINNFSSALSGTGTFYYDVTLTCTNVSPNFSVTWSSLTAQSGTLTLTSTQVNQLYAQTPNANSVSCTVTTRTRYDTISTEDGVPTSHDLTATANVTGSTPIFGGSFTYADTNSTTLGLTSNNQQIVQNQSTVNVTLNCAQMAMPQNAATISSYVCTIGSTSMTMANNSPSVAPTLTIPANSGSTLPGNTTYYVIYTWILSGQETFMSPEASINIPNGAKDNLVVTIPAFPANVTAANIYIGTTSNMETKQGQITTSAGSYTQSTTLTVGAAMPNMVFNMGKLNVSSNTTIYVKAIDSRGNIATITNTMTVLPYSSPTTSTNFARQNGFDSNTVLNLSGTFSNNIPNNTILSIKYTYQQSSLVGTNGYPALTNYPSFSVASPPNYTTSPPTVSLDNTINWSVQVVVQDKLSSTTTTVAVGPGVPLLFIDTNLKSVGVGKFPSGRNTFETNADILIGGATQSGIINIIGSTAGWFKLGTISMPQNGHTASINLYGGSSYNASDSQITTLNITIRTSNNSATSGGGTAVSAVAYRYGGSSLAFTGIKLVQNSAGIGATAYDVIINTGAYIGAASYEIIGTSSTTWVQSNTSVSDPGVASSTVYIVPMYYKVFDPFYSAKSTLDDGSGNMSVYGSLTARNGRTVMTSINSAYRIELITVTYSINGGTQFSVNGTFSSAFQTSPVVWYCNNQVAVAYTDVLMVPEVSNISTTGFACTFRIYNGSPNGSPTFGSGSSWFNFVAMGY